MLRRTFRHWPRIGPASEQRLSARGIADWDTALPRAHHEPRLAPPREPLVRDRARLAAEDAAHFARRLRARDHWRLYGEALFRRRAVELLPRNK
jgi:hypothetical protein